MRYALCVMRYVLCSIHDLLQEPHVVAHSITWFSQRDLSLDSYQALTCLALSCARVNTEPVQVSEW